MKTNLLLITIISITNLVGALKANAQTAPNPERSDKGKPAVPVSIRLPEVIDPNRRSQGIIIEEVSEGRSHMSSHNYSVIGYSMLDDGYKVMAVAEIDFATTITPALKAPGVRITFSGKLKSFKFIKGMELGPNPARYTLLASCAAELKDGSVTLNVKDIEKSEITTILIPPADAALAPKLNSRLVPPVTTPAVGTSISTAEKDGWKWKVQVEVGTAPESAAFVKYSLSVYGTVDGSSVGYGNDVEYGSPCFLESKSKESEIE